MINEIYDDLEQNIADAREKLADSVTKIVFSKYTQMELDTRDSLTKAVDQLAGDVVDMVANMIKACDESPTPVRNRHEAYGIAAEHLAKIQGNAKHIKDNCGSLLGTLADPNAPALEATASIVASIGKGVAIMLIACAEMKRTMSNLYDSENAGTFDTPMDRLAKEPEDFEEAEPVDDDDDE